MNSHLRHLVDALALEEFYGETCGCPATCIQSVEFSGFRVVHDREEIAADAVHHRLDHAHGGICGYGRVNRVAAMGEDCGASLRGQRTFCGNNSTQADYHRPPLRAVLRS